MNYLNEYQKWLNIEHLNEELKNELDLIRNDEEKIKNQFSCYLEFGTAGMRGMMGVGPNCINIYTIRRATIGLAKYVVNHNKKEEGVVIVYDTRNNSKFFALICAKVLTEFGIKVYLSNDVRPTPFISYAILKLKAFAGINITASHNRKEDNGYKIYLYNGAQFSPPDDEEIINLVNNVSEEEIFVKEDNNLKRNNLIFDIPKSVEDDFLNDALNLIIHKDFCKKHGKDLCVVYTPLHGTGYTFLGEAFKKAGFTNVNVVKSQNDKNGNFSTVSYPNPESKEAFTEALKLAKKVNADIIVATDPDADRLGVYVKHKNEYIPLTGNELPSLIFEYLLYFMKNKINLKETFAAKSFVTTRLIDLIADRYGVELKITPTGFKWIGREINDSKKNFVFGAEESYGCVVSSYVRDKDAIGTTLFVLYMALALKKANLSLYDLLKIMYNSYGDCANYSFSITYEGVDGKEKMDKIMDEFRNNNLKKITDIKVLKFIDYNEAKVYNYTNNEILSIDFPKTNTVKLILEDNSIITIRPSGTEPKIKIYFDVIDGSEELAKNKICILENAIKKLL